MSDMARIRDLTDPAFAGTAGCGVARRVAAVLRRLSAIWLIAAAAAGRMGTSFAEEASPPVGVLSHSARPPRDRGAELLVANARQRLNDGAIAEALSLFEETLHSSPGAYVSDVEVWRSVFDVAREAGGRSTPQMVNSLQTMEEELSRQFESVRDKGESELLAFSNRVPWSRSAARASFELAAREFDQGQFFTAAAGLRACALHPRAEGPLRERAAAMEIVSLVRSGQRRLAERRREEYSELLKRSKTTGPQGLALSSWADGALRSPSSAPVVWPPEGIHDHALTMKSPSVGAVWRFEATVPAELSMLLRESSEELRGQGVSLLSSGVPLVAKSTVVARLLDEVVALDLNSGAVKWRKATGSVWNQVSGNLKLLQNDGFADMIARRLVYRTQADSLYTRTSSDGLRVFAVVEGDVVPLPSASPPRLGNDPAANVISNHNVLVAWDLETGEELWRRGGADPTTTDRRKTGSPAVGSVNSMGEPAGPAASASGPHDWARGVLFLGAPRVNDAVLYSVGRQDSEFSLFAVHASDGELLWRLPLVQSMDEPAVGESRPLAPAAPVLLHEGLLLCPTCSGAVVAVDVARRVGVWCRRYPRDDVGRAGTSNQNQWSRQLLYPWWDGWRDVSVLAFDGKVILAGPDTNALHLLEARTGRRIWSRPRGDGLFVASMGSDGVIVLGERSVRCFDLTKGGVRWTAPVGTVAGRGSADATQLFVPLADGGIAVVSQKDGSFRKVLGEGGDSLGNVVGYADGAVAQTNDRLVRLAPLDARLESARQAVAVASVAKELRSLTRLQFEAGDFEAAAASAATLRTTQEDAVSRALQRDVLLAWMESAPEKASALWPTIEPLLETAELRIRGLERLARSAQRSGTPLEALQAWVRLLELNPSGEWTSRDTSETYSSTDVAASFLERRIARYDRHVQGEIADLLARASSDQRNMLREQLDQALDRSVRSPDPFALQRFAEHFGGLPWGRTVRVRQSVRTGIGVGFVKSQIGLLDLTMSDDRFVAASALREYVTFLDDRSWRVDAAVAARRLRDEFGDVPLVDGTAARDAVAALPAESLLARQIREGLPDPWPREPPKATATAERNRDVEFLPLPVQPAPGSLFERIGVSVDRTGKRLRFSGAQQRSAWEMTLPESKSMFRTANPLHRGWALGHLLVVRIGSELFGVTPFNDQGDPKGTVVWRVDMFGARTTKWNQLGVRVRPSAAGFGLDDVVLVDRFGRDLGQVGPVQPGYLCYRDQARLVAIDTATGSRLWERIDVPANVIVAGGPDRIVLATPGEDEVEVVRALDGKAIGRAKSPLPAESVLQWIGTSGLAADGPRIRMVDFAEAQTLWERPVSPGALPFAVDFERCGLVETDAKDGREGTLSVIRTADGTTLNVVSVELPTRFERIFSTTDERQVYVALSGAFANPDNRRLQNDRGGFRSPPASGRLLAISRETGRMIWNVELDDASLPHEQPRETPFLVVQHWRAGTSAAGSDNPACLQRLIDKRTGAELHRSSRQGELGWYVIDPNIDQKRIDIRDVQQTVRIQWE